MKQRTGLLVETGPHVAGVRATSGEEIPDELIARPYRTLPQTSRIGRLAEEHRRWAPVLQASGLKFG
ncbi:hypothetical protein XH92_32955 [Bradyrhizobium sp. CCBAU 53421]|nr:hypothetical protein XH92_32955 [Bradyrhizobium sp. CCBAU 53421]